MERITVTARIPHKQFTACGVRFEIVGEFDPDGENEYISDYFIGVDPWPKVMELQKLKFTEIVGVIYSF